jgi:transposase-like protein
VQVDHVTIHRWVHRFTPILAETARCTRHAIGFRWQVDETYVKVAGWWRYVYRAVDEYGQVIDVYLSPRRDGGAARRFFHHALATALVAPVEVVTDQAACYLQVLEKVLPAAWHRIERYANNRIEAEPRPVEKTAATDARSENRRRRQDCHRRARLHAEHPPRPLRTRR